MKDLNVYIEDLLYKHPCVIIPKFGAFISNRKSAKMRDDKTFMPPKRELTFNPSLNQNDGLLIKYVSEQTGITYNLVEDYVNLVVEGWKNILQQNRPLTFERVGTFTLTPEKRITFAPEEDVNYLTDSFGMTPFIPHEVPGSDLKIAENQIKPTLNEPVLPPEEELVTTIESPITQIAPPAVTAPNGNKKKKSEKPSGESKVVRLKPYIKYSAVAAVGLVILAYGAYLFFSEKVVNEDANGAQFAVTDSLVQDRLNQKLSEAAVFTPPISMPVVAMPVEKVTPKPGAKPSNNQATNSTNSTAATTTNSAATTGQSTTVAQPSSKPATSASAGASSATGTKMTNSALAAKKYQVIAGAFREEKNAQKRVQELQKLGYKNAFVLGTNAKGLYQVSYGGYDSMDEAKLLQKEIKESKEEKNLEGGWILTH
ncbi:SPOR domain-containing protein [Capnocytophaga sp. oral taxon 878]|uniref:HU domain-containing protein n=1 Tax=Capnocytophaga sp. oral taxon 878 TaxID=1316596 RepID=UPI000D0440D3|nr:SPOR domain-containing protein [Capnocytophaga sp. oral taxon 878]AVM51305.1 cell division protein [Capnocytophaga sp. oral taxon 878]